MPEEEKFIVIGDKIRQLRKENNLTQHEFGALFDLYDSTISMYETGKRTPEYQTIVKIADHFNVSIDWLLGRVETRDLIVIDKENMPEALKNIGVEYLKLAMEMNQQSIPPDDVRKIIEAIKALKSQDKKL